MHELQLQSVGLNQSMPFQSKLTNAVPPGEIDTSGAFGPWDADDPGGTPLNGTLRLRPCRPGRLQRHLRNPVRPRHLRRRARPDSGRRRNRYARLHGQSRRPSGAAQDQVPGDCRRDQRRHHARADRCLVLENLARRHRRGLRRQRRRRPHHQVGRHHGPGAARRRAADGGQDAEGAR